MTKSGRSFAVPQGLRPLLAMPLLLAVFAVLAAAPGRTQSESPGPVEAVIEGQALSFEAPEGYCALDRREEVDRVAFEITQRAVAPQNRLLVYFMNCEDYRRMHDGTIGWVSRYALVMVPGEGASRSPRHRETSRTAYIRQLTQFFSSEAFMQQTSGMVQQKFADMDIDHVLLGEQIDESLTAEERRVVEQVRSDVLAGRMSMFSLGSDAKAAYLGYSVPFDKEIQAGVAAMTLVNEISVVIAVYEIPARLELYEELKREASWMVRKAIAASE